MPRTLYRSASGIKLYVEPAKTADSVDIKTSIKTRGGASGPDAGRSRATKKKPSKKKVTTNKASKTKAPKKQAAKKK